MGKVDNVEMLLELKLGHIVALEDDKTANFIETEINGAFNGIEKSITPYVTRLSELLLDKYIADEFIRYHYITKKPLLTLGIDIKNEDLMLICPYTQFMKEVYELNLLINRIFNEFLNFKKVKMA